MKKFIIFALLIGVYWQWSHGKFPFGSASVAAVDAGGKPIAWIFTFDGCGDSCADAVRELRKRNVPFAEKVISPELRDEPDFKLWQGYGTGNSFPLLVMGEQSMTGFYVPDMASLLGKTFGDAYLTHNERRYFNAHFNTDGSPRIVLYGTDWCPHCATLRKELNANHVSFEDVDVERGGDKNQLLQTMGIAGYPAIWVGYTRVKNGASYSAIMAQVKQSK